MKKIVLRIQILFLLLFSMMSYSQVPNGAFASGTANWNVVGNNISLGAYASDYMFINNSTTVNETFALTSSAFNLLQSEVYSLDIIYGHYDNTFSGNQLSQLSNIVLKDASTNAVVETLTLTVQPWPLGAAPASEVDYYKSNVISVPDGSYYLEFSGAVGRSFLFTQSEIYAFKDVQINAVIPHSVSGNVKYDVNADNCATSATPLNNILIKNVAQSSGNIYYTYTDNNGDYFQEFYEIGNVVTSVESPSLTSTSITNTFTSAFQAYTNQDFCTQTTITTQHDLNIQIVPIGLARPGFGSAYRIYYTNLGVPNTSGVVTLSFDNTKLSYTSSIPLDNGFSGNSLTWNYTNLNFFETRFIDVFFTLYAPPTVNSGDVLTFNVIADPIVGDANTLDNTSSLNQDVVNAYDPNDVLCLEGDEIAPSQTGDDLIYRIRFQNTGTASAVNISVKTDLDADLDWATLQPISASHAYTTSLVNGNELTFNFNNINLDDSTTNEPESHGWIFYKIKPKSTVILGDDFDANAAIYFDFNAPVITNTYTTTIVTPLTYVPDDNFENYLETHDASGNVVAVGAANSMGNGIALDNYVATANINMVTILDVSSKSILDLTGIADFTQLLILNIGSNNNIVFDVSQNTMLESLYCHSSNLSSADLDVSQNAALKNLYCQNNQLSVLDISSNLNLEIINCFQNNITALDFSGKASLKSLTVFNNQLTSLNVKNGNNTNFTNFDSTNNPNLTCIEVDDAAWSTVNWLNKDAASTYVNNQAECTTLSTSAFAQITFSMYPNPVSNYLTIAIQAEASYGLITVNGQVIKNGQLQTGENILNVSKLSNGLYFLQVRTSEGVSTKKIVKQ
ncbi:DUF7619 domain-containing protein [Lacinutrix sp. MEBiC02404]